MTATAMDIINLTPHDVTVVHDDGGRDVFPAAGDVVRLETSEASTPATLNRGFRRMSYGDLSYDPVRKPGTWYIVSLVTALAARREDFLVPFNELRDDQGRIFGCRELVLVTA